MSENDIVCGPPGGTWRAERMMTEGTTKRFMFPSQVRAKMKPMVEARILNGEDISYASSSTEELVEAILRSQAYYEFTGPEKIKEVWRLKVHRYCVNMAAEILRKKPQLRTRASKLRLRHASKPGTPGTPEKDGEGTPIKGDVSMGGTMDGDDMAPSGMLDPTMGGENGTARIVAEAADTAKVREYLGMDTAGTGGTGDNAWVPANSWVAVNASGGTGNDLRAGSAPPTGTPGPSNETAGGRPAVSALSHLLQMNEDAARNLATSAVLNARTASVPLSSASSLRDLSDDDLRNHFLQSLDVMYERQLLPEILTALVEKNVLGAVAEQLRRT